MNSMVDILFNLKLFLEVFVELFWYLFIERKKCVTTTQLDGKFVVITGANTGIGKETAYQLSLRGAKIIIGSRDVKRGHKAIQQILVKNPLADITIFKLDLSSLTSVRQFVKSVTEEVIKIDILINNAGVLGVPQTISDGFETHFCTNYLGHFLLTLSLMPLMKKSLNARIINVSSNFGLKFGKINFEDINLQNGVYSPFKAYNQSKLAIILFTRQLAKRLGSDNNVKAFCVNPGIVCTDIDRNVFFHRINKLFMATFCLNTEVGAQTTIYCALQQNIEFESGSYYDDCQRIDSIPERVKDLGTAQRLWEMSCDFVKIEDNLRI